MATIPYLPEEDARFIAIEAITAVTVKKNAVTAISAGFGLSGLPTSASGLTTGMIWANSGVLTVV